MSSRTPPPVLFSELVDATVTDADVKAAIGRLLAKKSKSKEHYKEPVEQILIDYGTGLHQEIAESIKGHSLPLPDRDGDALLDDLLYRSAVSASGAYEESVD